MNCFHHPTEIAAAFCKGCGKPLCMKCCQAAFDNQRYVCSGDCARLVKLKPVPGEAPASPFQTIYAAVFLIVLLAVLGGGLCVWGAKSAIANEESYLRRETRGPLEGRRREYGNLFRIFYVLGITDWRAQFGIGAAIGAGGALLYLNKSGRKGVSDPAA